MISIFSYNRILKEQCIIEKGCRFQVAQKTDDKMAFTKAMSLEELLEVDARDRLTDLIYYEVKNSSDISNLKQLRQKESDALLMLLTSPSVSPMKYLKPGIAPDLLLLRPFDQEGFDEVNGELFDAFLEAVESSDPAENFVLSSKDGKTLIPYSKILFFEANNKKINLRVGSEEYDFYDSIENLLHVVPEYFVRSHRAYVVNTKKIRRIRMSEGFIELDGGTIVPLSRTCKQDFKNII